MNNKEIIKKSINRNVIMFDGNLTVIVIRTFADDSDSRDFWAQGPESGQ